VAKFQGDRSRDLGESVAKKKHLGQNISPSGNADSLYQYLLLPPLGGITIRRVCRLVRSLVCLLVCFVSSHPATGCNVRRAAGGSAVAYL